MKTLKCMTNAISELEQLTGIQTIEFNLKHHKEGVLPNTLFASMHFIALSGAAVLNGLLW